jgi:glycosyltransferase involved in cell wall biosynthesis
MAEGIADAIVRFDRDRPLMARMAQAASKRIAETYTEQKFVSAITAIYQAATNQV